MQQILQELANFRGKATSCVSLLLPAGSDLASHQRMLTKELSACANIKDKHNRSKVSDAIKSAQDHLKSLTQVPAHGLALFVGYCV
jgi:peptide subunit release factor 1 (eRF1)